MRPLIASLSLATALVLAGCFLSPTGANRATNALSVAAGGKVTLAFFPVGDAQPAKVTFKVAGQEVSGFDDSADDGFAVELDVSSLAPNVYTVDVSLDDAEPSAQLNFVVPDPNAGTPAAGEPAAGEPAAESTAEPTDEPTAEPTEAPAEAS